MTRRRHDLDSLLEVAVRVYTERGFDGTSMGDLAAAAGLSKSSLYHHVESKEQLLRLALDRAVEPLFAVIEEPEAVTGRAIDRLEHVVRREVEVLVERLPYVTLLLRVRGNSETERWALDRRREFDHVVAGLVAQAAAEGDVRGGRRPGPGLAAAVRHGQLAGRVVRPAGARPPWAPVRWPTPWCARPSRA